MPILVTPLRPVAGDLLASPNASNTKKATTITARVTVEMSFQCLRNLLSYTENLSPTFRHLVRSVIATGFMCGESGPVEKHRDY